MSVELTYGLNTTSKLYRITFQNVYALLVSICISIPTISACFHVSPWSGTANLRSLIFKDNATNRNEGGRHERLPSISAACLQN
jgi:hypothetical protein